MNSIFWVGKYESDIEHCNFFSGSITYYGSNKNNNFAFCKNDTRISSLLSDAYISFVMQTMKFQIAKNYDTKFLFYNQVLANEITSLVKEFETHILCINSSSILNTLNNKIYCKLWLSNILKSVPFKVLSKSVCTFKRLKNIFPNYDYFIVQKNISSGGKGTFLLNKYNEESICKQLEDNELYNVSPYIKNSYSINMHICITDDIIIQFPISLQILKEIDHKLLFLGSDYIEAKNIPEYVVDQIYIKTNEISNELKTLGYRGVLGIDLLVTANEIYFIEINPRFQGSSMPLSKALVENNLPSLYEIHTRAFFNKIDKNLQKKIQTTSINYSFINYSNFFPTENLLYLYHKMSSNKCYDIYTDGYKEDKPIDYNAYIFRILFSTNICSVNKDHSINIAENLLVDKKFQIPIHSADDVISLKISLLMRGVILSSSAIKYITQKSSIKNATFNAIDVKILDGLKVNCPINIPFSDLSPFYIEYDPLNGLQLYYDNYYISNIEVDTNENLLDKITISGIPYSKIGFKTNDRVRIRHTSVCYFKENGQSCSFCESKHNKKVPFDENDIYEVIDAYEKYVDFRHYLIGGASEQIDIEPLRIKKIIQYIRNHSKKPIYLMSLPPKDISHIYDYYQLGLNEVAFNLEVFNREIAVQVMPGKGAIPLEQYMNALEESTKYLGKTGNVRSMLIIGLEPEDSLLKGIKTLSSIGVSPMLSVFRPMPMSSMKKIVPPSIATVKDIFNKAENICNEYNVQLGPACEQCQNNTISLPFRYKEIFNKN